MNISEELIIREDGPREGFQSLKQMVSLDDKLKLIELLELAGARSIEVAAFVRPDKVPQMKDASSIAASLTPKENVRYRALYLNQKGLERALEHQSLSLEGYILISASEAFLKRNNNQTIDDVIEKIPNYLELFSQYSLLPGRLMISCAFGDRISGRIDAKKTIAILKRVIDKVNSAGNFAGNFAGSGSSLQEVTFADTTGFAGPESVKKLVSETKNLWPELNVGLHIHDTRGLGLLNVHAGLLEGATRFDSSVAGLGGCPFTENAAGNVCTEDMAFMFEELGINTGLNLEAYIEASKFAEKIAGIKLPGKLKDGGLL